MTFFPENLGALIAQLPLIISKMAQLKPTCPPKPQGTQGPGWLPLRRRLWKRTCSPPLMHDQIPSLLQQLSWEATLNRQQGAVGTGPTGVTGSSPHLRRAWENSLELPARDTVKRSSLAFFLHPWSLSRGP